MARWSRRWWNNLWIRNAATVGCVSLLFAGLLSAITPLSSRPKEYGKHVLLLYSDNVRLPFSEVEDEVFRERLTSLGQPVEIVSENLDASLLGDKISDKLVADFYRRKYNNVHFDVIIAIKPAALGFLLAHRSDVFDNSPVVFCDISNTEKVIDQLKPGVAGALIDYSVISSLNLIRQIQPETKRIVVIFGASQREALSAALNQSQTESFASQVPVDYWLGLTPDELRVKLADLPPRAVVLYISEMKDREGRSFVPRDLLTEIAAFSKVPVYSISTTYLGTGTVGGRMVDPTTDANIAADFAERVLKGENPESFQTVTEPSTYGFDARALRRFGIPESRLPAGSQILFQEPSAWSRFGLYILGMLLFLAIETALVVMLLLARRRAKRSRMLLERRFAIEKLISEASTRLSECPAEQVNGEIESSLRSLLAAEEADRTSWFVIPASGSKINEVCSARPSGVDPEPVFYSRPELPWSTAILLRGESVAVSDLDLLPPEADRDKAYFAQRRVKSVALVPSSSGTAAQSVLVVVSFENKREWPMTLTSRLGVLGNIFANASMRKQAQEAKQNSENRFSYLFKEAPFGIAIEDVDGQILFANPALASMLGYTAEELCHTKCTEFADDEDEKDDWEHFQQMRAGFRQNYQIEKRYTRKDGVRVWGRLSVSLLKGSAQWAPMVLATVEDITEKKAQEHELQLAQGQVRHLAGRILQAQDDERQRIARELHDDIGQRLSLLMMELDVLQTELPVDRTSEQAKIHYLLTQLDEIVSDVHGMSHQLHSAKLEHLGLAVALKEVCRQVSTQHHVAVELQADDVSRSAPSPVSLCFYRVAQEALNNAAKHSRSPRIEVKLTNEGSKLRMQIRDFGVGFDLSAPSNGIGLITMQERLRAIGGSLLINSRIGIGTELSAEATVELLPSAVRVA
jgi:PAS domain S-box-containing protein